METATPPSESSSTTGPVGRILLATDLSPHCDRAMERARQLATEWKAELSVVYVIGGPEAPDEALAPRDRERTRATLAQRALDREFADAPFPVSTHIAHGEVEAAIRELATASGCGLVVIGTSRNESFGRFLLGSTARRLAPALAQPLLVVRSRVHAPYQRVLVGVDFSQGSRRALAEATRLFPGRIIVFHARRVAETPNLTDPGTAPETILPDAEVTAFLESCDLPADVRERLQVVVRDGALAGTLTAYVRDHDIDLVVLGTERRGGLLQRILGGDSEDLLDWLPCDTLLTAEPRG